MAAIRQRAWTLLYSSGVDDVAAAIAAECGTEGWKIREDKPLFVDNGLKDVVTHLLFHYHPAALRVALETVTGHSLVFGPSALNDGGYSVLRRFIHKTLTFSSALAEQYEHTVKGVWDKEHAAKQNAEALQRVMTVLLMLDAMGTSSTGSALMQSLGLFCVFLPESPIKSTRSMLIQISRELLAAEGDVVKHATAIGFAPRYTQSPLQELTYALPKSVRSTEALVDALKDGTRLCRLAELLAGEVPLSLVKQCIRVPTNSRTTKVRNVNLFLKHIANEHGVQLGDGKGAVTADAIIAGKVGQVSTLLWSMLSHWALPLITPPWKVRSEIIAVLRHAPHVAVEMITRPVQGVAKAASTAGLLNACRDPVTMLLLWAQAIAAGAGVQVRDWSISWADGRALVAIIRHYNPSALSASLLMPTEHSAPIAERKRTQQSRVVQACTAAHSLGFVPLMLPVFDATTPPHPRGMMLYIAYLAARLLAQAKEGRAAMILQRRWRQYHMLKAAVSTARLQAARTTAARIKLRAWVAGAGDMLRARKASRAAVTIQRQVRTQRIAKAMMEAATVRRVLATRLRLRAAWAMRNVSANRAGVVTRITTWWRMHMAAAAFSKLQRGIRSLQAVARGSSVRLAVWSGSNFAQWSASARRIQNSWRVQVAAVQYQRFRSALVCLQATWRMQLVLASQHMQLEDTAALVISWTLRDWSVRQRYRRFRAAVCALQAAMRQRLSIQRLSRHRHAARKLSRALAGISLRRVVGARVRQTLLRRQAVLALQCVWRVHSARVALVALRRDKHARCAQQMQAAWRGCMGRRVAAAALATQVAALTVTTCMRMAAAKRTLRAAKFIAHSVTLLHTGRQARAGFCRARCAVLALQRRLRFHRFLGGLMRLAGLRQERAGGVIKAWWRHIAAGTAKVSAALSLQRVWRGFSARRAASAFAQAEALVGLRRRITAAAASAAAAPQSTLGARCVRAMKTLHCSDNLTAVLRALLVLQSCTRLSVECCRLAGDADAATVLFGIVRSCNRSAPHQHVIQATLSILRNIASRASSRRYLASCSEAVPVLVDLMQMFRDCLAIHRPATRLLIVLAAGSDAVVQRMTGDLAMMKRLTSIHTIITRKVTMEARRRSGVTGTVGFGAGTVASTIQDLQGDDVDFTSMQGKQRHGALLLAAARALGCACHLTDDATFAVADIEELLQILQAPFMLAGQAAQ
jgi:hypothetical protein